MSNWPTAFLSDKHWNLMTVERYLKDKESKNSIPSQVLVKAWEILNEKTGEWESIEDRSERLWSEAAEKRWKLTTTKSTEEKAKQLRSEAKAKLSLEAKQPTEEIKPNVLDNKIEKEALVKEARALWINAFVSRWSETIKMKIAEKKQTNLTK